MKTGISSCSSSSSLPQRLSDGRAASRVLRNSVQSSPWPAEERRGPLMTTYVRQQDRNQAATLWCGNLADQCTEEILWELFIQCGPLRKRGVSRVGSASP